MILKVEDGKGRNYQNSKYLQRMGFGEMKTHIRQKEQSRKKKIGLDLPILNLIEDQIS